MLDVYLGRCGILSQTTLFQTILGIVRAVSGGKHGVAWPIISFWPNLPAKRTNLNSVTEA